MHLCKIVLLVKKVANDKKTDTLLIRAKQVPVSRFLVYVIYGLCDLQLIAANVT